MPAKRIMSVAVVFLVLPKPQMRFSLCSGMQKMQPATAVTACAEQIVSARISIYWE